MIYGTQGHGQKPLKSRYKAVGIGRPFAASAVNVVDSIVITEELNINKVLAEWTAYEPGITVYGNLTSAQAVKLFLNWSDRNGTVNLHQGDYFTFVVPDIFVYDYIVNAADVPITNEVGEIEATYSIYDNSDNKKEVKITFTDFVENHTNISGDFWMLLFVGNVASTEQKNIDFVINDNLVAQGEVTINPNTDTFTPREYKVGFSSPAASAGGYYIFEWHVFLNMGENAVNGFNTLNGFSFEDIIPAESPHVFLTNEIRQELGIPPAEYASKIGEYTGADSVPPENRYSVFLNQFNSTGADSWYNSIQWHTMTGGLTTAGIDGKDGLHITNIEVADKLLSANLGTVTRPTVITLYTISTIQLNESALGDSEVVELFKNMFLGSYGEALNASLTLYRFGAGGSAQGISGDYGFSFNKINEKGAALPGARFSLFISENFAAGADRFVFSGSDGVVTFNRLPAGTFYFQETVPPYGYLPDNTIYKVVLGSEGYEIYYGDNFEKKLSDLGNNIINKSELDTQPAIVILPGRKNLSGSTLINGMFSFVVKDSEGATVATGTNSVDGSIQFSGIELTEPGVYTFTVEEVKGTDSGIIYDGSVFTVTVTVTDDGDGNLTADVSYPYDGIVFNNRFITTPVSAILCGKKCLTGNCFISGAFSFIVRNSGGNPVATGRSNADGSIRFTPIEFTEPGVYTFTVEEVKGADRGIIYDGSIFIVTVTVTVTNTGNGNLTAKVTYPSGGIVFNNRYVTPPLIPVQCCAPCFRPTCKLSCKPRCRPRNMRATPRRGKKALKNKQ